MIKLADQKPDFTGTWFQGKKSGDFKIYILDIQANKFFGVKIDSNGIAEIEGQINSDITFFIKVYARYVTDMTKASKIPMEYVFEQNVFEVEVGQEIQGEWFFSLSGFPQGGSCILKVENNLKEFLPQEISPIDLELFEYFSSKKQLMEKVTLGSNSGSSDDLPF